MSLTIKNNFQSRADNISQVMLRIFQAKSISRKDLAKELGVTPPTISMIVEELLRSDLVLEKGTGKSLGGRKPILLEVNPDFGQIIALDLGSHYIHYGIYNAALERKFGGSIVIQSEDELVKKLMELVASLMQKHTEVRTLGIGVSISGVVSDRKEIKYSSVLHLKDLPLKRILEHEFQTTVWIEERVRCASIASMWLHPSEWKQEHSVYLHIGRGIGASIVSNGSIAYGFNESAGELGHMIIRPDGPRCSCGSRGCLETLASERALLQHVQDSIAAGRKTMLVAATGSVATADSVATGNDPEPAGTAAATDSAASAASVSADPAAAALSSAADATSASSAATATGSKLTGNAVVEAAAAGDEVALEAVRYVCQHLAIGVINVIRLLDPAHISIMNSISESDELFNRYLIACLNDYSSQNYEWRTSITFETDKHISMHGAAAIILEDAFLHLRERYIS